MTTGGRYYSHAKFCDLCPEVEALAFGATCQTGALLLGVDREIAKLKAERDALLERDWSDKPDEWSAPIDEAFPTKSGSHDEYGIAMRMVGNRHSKGELIALVNWLLVDREKQEGYGLRVALEHAETKVQLAELAQDVGCALLVAALAPGESLAAKNESAIVGAVETLRMEVARVRSQLRELADAIGLKWEGKSHEENVEAARGYFATAKMIARAADRMREHEKKQDDIIRDLLRERDAAQAAHDLLRRAWEERTSHGLQLEQAGQRAIETLKGIAREPCCFAPEPCYGCYSCAARKATA